MGHDMAVGFYLTGDKTRCSQHHGHTHKRSLISYMTNSPEIREVMSRELHP